MTSFVKYVGKNIVGEWKLKKKFAGIATKKKKKKH